MFNAWVFRLTDWEITHRFSGKCIFLVGTSPSTPFQKNGKWRVDPYMFLHFRKMENGELTPYLFSKCPMSRADPSFFPSLSKQIGF
jgi:hypothetical protein